MGAEIKRPDRDCQHLLSNFDHQSAVIRGGIHCHNQNAMQLQLLDILRKGQVVDTLQCSQWMEHYVYPHTLLRLKAKLTPLVERHFRKCRREVEVDEAG